MECIHPGNESGRPRNIGSRRVSNVIRRRPAVNIHHATRFAERLGLPLQLAVTINFSLMGIPPELVVELFRTMLAQRFAPWLRRIPANKMGIPPTYVWVTEAAGGQQAVHWLLHLPYGLISEFRGKLRTWLSAVSAEGRLPERALKVQKVYNVIGVRRYILKGTDPPWVPRRLPPQHFAA